jgi:hypothetical protein
MKASPLERSSSQHKTHVLLDRRYAERVPMHVRVMYASEAGSRLVKAEGSLINLSKTGCKVLATTPPPAGSRITMFLYLQDGKPPMCLTGMTIPWVAGLMFSVRFPKLTPDERKRVQEMIWKHATLTRSGQQRAAFRIV